MNKKISLLLCVVMSIICLVGCGGKSDEEILTGAVNQMNQVKSLEIQTKISGKMSAKMGEETEDMELSSDLKGSFFSEPFKMKMTGTTSSMGQTAAIETYLQKDNDKYVCYSKVEEDWMKTEMENMDELMQASGINSLFNQLSADPKKYVEKENKTEGDQTYLVYEYTISAEEMKTMVESAFSSVRSLVGSTMEESEVDDLLNKVASSMDQITITLYIDQETQQITRMEYSMTEMMNKMINSFMQFIKDKTVADAKKEDAGISEEEINKMTASFDAVQISATDMNVVQLYSKIDQAEDFTIPEDALKAKSMDELMKDLSVEEE